MNPANTHTYCQACKAELEPNSKFCANCGTHVPQTPRCVGCNNPIDLTQRFCKNCGKELISNPPSSSSLGITDATVGRVNQETANEEDGTSSLGIADATVGTVNQTVQHITHNYASPTPTAAGEVERDEDKFCNSCHQFLTVDKFLCPECRRTFCNNCRSVKGPCLLCNPYTIPGAPLKVRATIEKRNAGISWSTPANDGGKPILGFTITVTKDDVPIDSLEAKESGTKAIVSNLEEGGPYTFAITARNEIGMGPTAESQPFNILLSHCYICKIELDDAPITCSKCRNEIGPECLTNQGLCKSCYAELATVRPTDVRVALVPRNTDDVIISWQPPKDHRDSPTTGYMIRCLEDARIYLTVPVEETGGEEARQYIKYCLACGEENLPDLRLCNSCGATHTRVSDQPSGKSSYSAIIHNLTTGISYSFTVSAINESNGEGPASEPSSLLKLGGQKLLPLIAKLGNGEICTIAGTGKAGYSGDGLQSINANLNEPYDVAVDELGNIYIADSGNHRIRKISVDDGTITTDVGNGDAGFSGDGRNPRNAKLNKPRGIDFDNLGNLFISDRDNHRVRRVNSSSTTIDSFAGNGIDGRGGDGLRANQHAIGLPECIAVDRSTGFVYITGPVSGFASKKVRVVNGKGAISTFAGSGGSDNPKAGSKATDAKFSNLDDLFVAPDSAGNVYLGDQNSRKLYKIDCKTNSISVVAGNGKAGSFGGDGKPLETTLEPQGLAFSTSANAIYINDGGSVMSGNKRIRKLDLNTNLLATIAGDGNAGFEGDNGPSRSARFNKPRNMCVDSYGNLYIADTGNHRIRVIRNISSSSNPVSPARLADKAPAEEAQRLNWFEDWLQYEQGKKDGYVTFENDRSCYMQFSFAQNKRGIVAEVGTCQWENIFGSPIPDSVGKKLSAIGFQPPDRKHGPNHWHEFAKFNPRALAGLADWAFKEIFGENEGYTVRAMGSE
jgi:DNA-binding beta-propeller fold protein YncE